MHSESSLSRPELEKLRNVWTSDLVGSLKPSEPGSLEVRRDRTIIDGHHRIQVLRERGVVAAAVLVSAGEEPARAFRSIESTRGRPVPDTTEQRSWVERFAAGLCAETRDRRREGWGGGNP